MKQAVNNKDFKKSVKEIIRKNSTMSQTPSVAMPPLEPPVAQKAPMNEPISLLMKQQNKRSSSNISVDKPWDQSPSLGGTRAFGFINRQMIDDRKSSFNLLNDSIVMQGISDIKIVDKNRNLKNNSKTLKVSRKPSSDLCHLEIFNRYTKEKKVYRDEKIQLNMPVTIEQEEEYYLRRSIEQVETRNGQRIHILS